MAVLTAAGVITGALCLLNLLLTFGVIRRLREHTALLAADGHPAGAGKPAPRATELADGEAPGGFSVTTVSGQRLDGPAGLRMVAFLSTRCQACAERVPSFLTYLAAYSIGQEMALAVIEGEGVPDFQDRLAGAVQLCAGTEGTKVSGAFKINGYPTFCLLAADGTLLASSFDPMVLPAPAPA